MKAMARRQKGTAYSIDELAELRKYGEDHTTEEFARKYFGNNFNVAQATLSYLKVKTLKNDKRLPGSKKTIADMFNDRKNDLVCQRWVS